MLVIGLTGGIGSGKSTVADIFRQLGAPVIDTDEISRQLVSTGQPALNDITSVFTDVLTADGSLDRGKLRQIIFEHSEKRQQLENILHPRIRDEVEQQLKKLQSDYVIIVIPLLAEKGRWPFIDRVLVVDCSEELQLQRAMARDNQDKQQIENILKVQASRQQRLAIADDVISNNSDLEHLRQCVQQLAQAYRRAADN